MVPIIEKDSILILGYSIVYKESYLTGFNHQKDATHLPFRSPSQDLHTLNRGRGSGFLGCRASGPEAPKA